MSFSWQEDIETFHVACGHHIGVKPWIPPIPVQELRYSLIYEEMRETLKAIREDDLVGIADGIVDSIVVLLGTAVSYGITLQPIWDEVHRTNMAKVGGGKNREGKSLKPEGWEPPGIRGLLIKQGAKL